MNYFARAKARLSNIGLTCEALSWRGFCTYLDNAAFPPKQKA